MKQTAVEWLFEQINSIGFQDPAAGELYLEIQPLIEQAKEMEREQIIDFANNYGFDICAYDYERAEQYYNETFKSE